MRRHLDNRDPEAIGRMFFELRKKHPDGPATLIMDTVIIDHPVPDYPKHESLVRETSADYRRAMRKRADEGDRFARVVLVEHGWSTQDDAWAPEIAADVERSRALQAAGVDDDPATTADAPVHHTSGLDNNGDAVQ